MAAEAIVTGLGSPEYTGAHQLHKYEDVSGLRVVARAAAGAAPKVVRVHGDFGLRQVGWSSARGGRPPVVPEPGDILVGPTSSGDGALVTDVYLGGTVSVPLPQINQQQGGFDWEVNGAYTYLQVHNRKLGTDPLPTGGYPYQVPASDGLAELYMTDHGITISAPDGVTNVEAQAMVAAGEALVDHAAAYPWPFTTLPIQTVSSALFGG